MAHYTFQNISSEKKSLFGKVSAFAFVKGSVTVEAALAVPLFFLGVICMLYLMEIMAIQTAVHSGLHEAGKRVMEEGYPLPLLKPQSVEADVVNSIGPERLERSIVMGGSTGIDCSSSYISPVTGIGEVCAEYRVKLPIALFPIPPITYQDSLKIKAWTGFEKGGLDFGNHETVYVTETGLVYHKDYHCTYLDLSIRMVEQGSLEGLRNSSGGIYYSCPLCKGGNSGGVYITDYGERYHSSLSCSGLKRTVYAVPLSEAVGKGACSKCGK